jgi:hypothetical protein
VSRSSGWDLALAPPYHGGVRDGLPLHVLICSLALLGCRSEPSSTTGTTDKTEPAPVRAEPDSTEPVSPVPERSTDHADRVADLDALCRALDHDYVDGTLSDYYAKVVPKTAWGRERLREGEESITPGRLLQKATTELAVDLDDPELAGCHKLFDEIDDLE